MKPRFSVAITLLLAVQPALADAWPQAPRPSGQQLRHEAKVTVTADRLEEEVVEVGSSVTVITADDIAASGARWLADVLARVPGLTVARTAGPGSATNVFLRGTSSNHTLFLINGVRANSPGTGAYDLAHLPASRIERIEIVRGPQSVLHGSDAIGGVINVITRSGSGPASFGLTADGGSFATGAAAAWVEGRQDAVDYSANLSFFGNGGFSAASERRGNVEDDGYRNLMLDGRVGWSSPSGLTIEGFVRAFDADVDIDDFAFGVGPVDDGDFVQDSREAYVGGRLRWTGRVGSTSLAVSDTEIDLETDNPDSAFPGFDLDAAVFEIDWQNELPLPARQTLVAGVEYRREAATVLSRSIFGDSGFDRDVDTVGLFVEDRLTPIDAVALTLGARYEDHSAFGGHTTARATGSARLGGSGLRAHGSVGTAFRAPSLNELFFPGFGNPELRPEESAGYDLGLEGNWRRPDLWLDVTWFRNDIDELIEFGIAGFDNIGSVRTRGVELSGGWAPHAAARLDASYTFTDAFQEGEGLQLVRRPRHQGTISATVLPIDGLRLFTELRTKGERADSGPTGRVTLDGFALWNVAGEYALGPAVAVRGRLENLLDSDYEEVFGFGTAGRSGYLGLTLRFSAGG